MDSYNIIKGCKNRHGAIVILLKFLNNSILLFWVVISVKSCPIKDITMLVIKSEINSGSCTHISQILNCHFVLLYSGAMVTTLICL